MNYLITKPDKKEIKELVELETLVRGITYSNLFKNLKIEDFTTNPKSLKNRILLVKRALKNSNEFIKIVRYDNKIIGFIRATKYQKTGKIKSLFIHPHYQNLGFGNELMKESLDWLSNRYKITLEVVKINQIAINFYKKLGFKESHKPAKPLIVKDFNIERIKMKKYNF